MEKWWTYVPVDTEGSPKERQQKERYNPLGAIFINPIMSGLMNLGN